MRIKLFLSTLVAMAPFLFSNPSMAQNTACIDSDGDGYGWNGVETCTPPETDVAVCLDTDPVGDGWGWNGITSCRVLPSTSNKIDELAVIAANTNSTPTGSVARVFCPVTPAGAPARTMNFFYSGWFSTQISDLFGGMWSTGTDAEDGWVTVLSSRSGTSWRMFMEGDTVFRESIGELHACEWL